MITETRSRTYVRPTLAALGRRRDFWHAVAAVLVDVGAFYCAFALATLLRFGADVLLAAGPYGAMLWIWSVASVGGMALSGGYARRRLNAAVDELKNVLRALVLGAAVVIVVAFGMQLPLSRIWITLAFGLALTLVPVSRWFARQALRALRSRGLLRRRALVLGVGHRALRLGRSVAQSAWQGIDVVGYVRCPGEEVVAVPGGLMAGGLEELRELVLVHRIEEVVVSSGVAGSGQVSSVLTALDGIAVEVLVEPGIEELLPSRCAIYQRGETPVIALERVELHLFARVAKRILDVLIAVPALIFAAPLMAVIASLIFAEDRGSPVFKQVRVGQGGRRFTLLKFRSMVKDADVTLDSLIELNEADGLLFKLRRDPRVTRVGRFLRRSSLDELPQLWNVLKGDMSLVGPRPPLPGEAARYDERLARRLGVKPGMTGLWQVNGRNDLDFEDYARYDILYAQNWSLALDLSILFKTIPAVLTGRGAY